VFCTIILAEQRTGEFIGDLRKELSK